MAAPFNGVRFRSASGHATSGDAGALVLCQRQFTREVRSGGRGYCADRSAGSCQSFFHILLDSLNFVTTMISSGMLRILEAKNAVWDEDVYQRGTA